METLPNNSAFPEIQSNQNMDRQIDEVYSEGGLTKREYFAAKALQGLTTNFINEDMSAFMYESYAIQAVALADSLIEQLNKEK